jgi:trimeric autotransporter adhesin
MKKVLLGLAFVTLIISTANSQITRLSNNTSYDDAITLADTKIILRSKVTKTLWVYDIPGNSFTQLSTIVTVEDNNYQYQIMNGRVYFVGKTAAEGIELWSTDGTPGGTGIVKNINTGTADSDPKDGFVIFNNELYFSAIDATHGRELWKTNGTDAGTVLVKDINPTGDAFPTSAVFTPHTSFGVIGGVLVFTATSHITPGLPPLGDFPDQELWKTNGTDGGTILLKDIYPGDSSSYISNFTQYGTNLIFTAFDPTNGDALWKTDGSVSGTVMVKDINTGTPIQPPFYFSEPTITPAFFNFQNKLYFTANNGTNGFELWVTDATNGGTSLVKDINPGSPDAFPFGFAYVSLAVKNNSKFFFAAATANEGTELWESDGTPSGTNLLKDIAPGGVSSDVLTIPNFLTNGLFQGNKFFLVANTPAEGTELWISDGTAGGTQLVKDIYPGTNDGTAGSALIYTNTKAYFTANDGTHGEELWQTDGTPTGTSLVQDVNITPTPADSSDMQFATIASNKIYLFGTDGDDALLTDFFRLEAPVSALPLRWISFEAKPSNDDILLSWQTADEDKTNHFIVQRSSDGSNYADLGRVTAVGTGSNSYSFSDRLAMKAGVKKWYYRVKYVDIDGKAALSRIASVALNNPIASILISPNPVRNKLNLVIESTGNDQAFIRVTDMGGKTVLQKAVSVNRGRNNVSADANHLPNGSYLLQIFMGGSATTERFLIQR